MWVKSEILWFPSDNLSLLLLVFFLTISPCFVALALFVNLTHCLIASYPTRFAPHYLNFHVFLFSNYIPKAQTTLMVKCHLIHKLKSYLLTCSRWWKQNEWSTWSPNMRVEEKYLVSVSSIQLRHLHIQWHFISCHIVSYNLLCHTWYIMVCIEWMQVKSLQLSQTANGSLGYQTSSGRSLTRTSNGGFLISSLANCPLAKCPGFIKQYLEHTCVENRNSGVRS